MNIRVISTGHSFHNVDSALAQLLMELHPGNIERVGVLSDKNNLPSAPHSEKPPLPKTTEYGIVDNGFGVSVQISKPSGEVFHFKGNPDRMPAGVPADVAAEYRRQYRPPKS